MPHKPSDPFARKPIETLLSEMEGGKRLHRVLGPVALTALGVGATIGTGLFVLTGEAAYKFAGPSLILSFVLAGFGCGLAALCYSELASMVPVAGSAYTYAYATLGELDGLDHRLGPDPRIRDQLVPRWPVSWADYFDDALPRILFGFSDRSEAPVSLAVGLRRAHRLVPAAPGDRHPLRRTGPPRSSPGSTVPAVVVIAHGDHGNPGRRHPRERPASTPGDGRS